MRRSFVLAGLTAGGTLGLAVPAQADIQFFDIDTVDATQNGDAIGVEGDIECDEGEGAGIVTKVTQNPADTSTNEGGQGFDSNAEGYAASGPPGFDCAGQQQEYAYTVEKTDGSDDFQDTEPVGVQTVVGTTEGGQVGQGIEDLEFVFDCLHGQEEQDPERCIPLLLRDN